MNTRLPSDNEEWSARKARRTHGQHTETKVGQVHRSDGTGNDYLRARAPALGHSARANNRSYCDNRKRLRDDAGSVQNLACRGRKALYCKDVANLACIPGPSRRRFDRDRRAPHFLTTCVRRSSRLVCRSRSSCFLLPRGGDCFQARSCCDCPIDAVRGE
jgi:hypothetical protein